MRRGFDMMSDLLQYAIDAQWAGRTNTACHCHPEYVSCCLECGEHKADDEHTEDCKLMALIKEARAFLEAENEMIEAKNDGEEPITIPY